MSEPIVENDAAIWIDANRDRRDKINAAVRDVEEALDDLTRLATWGHLTRSAGSVQRAADRLVDAVAEARVVPCATDDGRCPMSAHGMSDGLREAVEALAAECEALWAHIDSIRAEYERKASNPSSRFVRAVDVLDALPVRPAPEADPTAGEHRVVDADPSNPHRGGNPDCTGTLCPACGCCMHCVAGDCGCAVTDECPDPDCCCPYERDLPAAGERIAQAIEAGVQPSQPNEGYKDGFRRAANIAREVTS